MKSLIVTLLTALFSLCVLKAKAQLTKPVLFKSFPEKIKCHTVEFDKAFVSGKGNQVELSFSDDFIFKGNVVSNVVKYANLHSVVIRSPYFSNAICHLSKITREDKTVVYAGQIINQAYGDCYQLKQDATGAYQFVKIKLENIMSTCAQ